MRWILLLIFLVGPVATVAIFLKCGQPFTLGDIWFCFLWSAPHLISMALAWASQRKNCERITVPFCAIFIAVAGNWIILEELSRPVPDPLVFATVLIYQLLAVLVLAVARDIIRFVSILIRNRNCDEFVGHDDPP